MGNLTGRHTSVPFWYMPMSQSLTINQKYLHLSDNEKRDVIKYLEADKPLPEKYKFLLFEDKREVELVWNGKTNEVTNFVLPFQIIEGRF